MDCMMLLEVQRVNVLYLLTCMFYVHVFAWDKMHVVCPLSSPVCFATFLMYLFVG